MVAAAFRSCRRRNPAPDACVEFSVSCGLRCRSWLWELSRMRQVRGRAPNLAAEQSTGYYESLRPRFQLLDLLYSGSCRCLFCAPEWKISVTAFGFLNGVLKLRQSCVTSVHVRATVKRTSLVQGKAASKISRFGIPGRKICPKMRKIALGCMMYGVIRPNRLCPSAPSSLSCLERRAALPCLTKIGAYLDECSSLLKLRP